VGQTATAARLGLRSAWSVTRVTDSECFIGHGCSTAAHKSRGRLRSAVGLGEGNA